MLSGVPDLCQGRVHKNGEHQCATSILPFEVVTINLYRLPRTQRGYLDQRFQCRQILEHRSGHRALCVVCTIEKGRKEIIIFEQYQLNNKISFQDHPELGDFAHFQRNQSK